MSFFASGYGTPSGSCYPEMEFQTEIEENKIADACRKITDRINSMSFDERFKDQQVLSLLKIREIACGVVDGRQVKVTDSHVVEVLRSSINSMVAASKDIVEKISNMSYEGLEDQWVQSLKMLEELASGMDDKQEVQEIDSVRFTDSLVDEESQQTDQFFLGIEGPMDMATHTNSEELINEKGLISWETLNQKQEQDTPLQISHWHLIYWPPDGNITIEWLKNMMTIFAQSSHEISPSDFHKTVMPVASVECLIDIASRILHEEPNCVKIDSSGEDSEVVVVGDIHGQFHDLLNLWDSAGYASENKYFVFNGNYVNRGAWGLEVLLVLLAWKVLTPNRIFLLRGNHESKLCTENYGFMYEVKEKFGKQGDHVYKKCLKCFKELPLASIIGGCVYTTHGGLFRSTQVDSETFSLGSLEEMARVDRHFEDAPDASAPNDALNVILTDVLWSDPTTSKGLQENKRRGVGLHWGPDCTNDFLKKHRLKSIIRSHEGPDARFGWKGDANMRNGYYKDHAVESGDLYTLFSAPDYPQFQDARVKRFKNRGAYAILKPPDYDPCFYSFNAAEKPKSYPYEGSSCKEVTLGHELATVNAHSPTQQSAGFDFSPVPPSANTPEPHRSDYEHLMKLISESVEREKKLMAQIGVLKNTVEDDNSGKHDQKLIEQISAIESTLKASSSSTGIGVVGPSVPLPLNSRSSSEDNDNSQPPAKRRLRAEGRMFSDNM